MVVKMISKGWDDVLKEEYEKEEKYDVMKELQVDTTVSNEKIENTIKKTQKK